MADPDSLIKKTLVPLKYTVQTTKVNQWIISCFASIDIFCSKKPKTKQKQMKFWSKVIFRAFLVKIFKNKEWIKTVWNNFLDTCIQMTLPIFEIFLVQKYFFSYPCYKRVKKHFSAISQNTILSKKTWRFEQIQLEIPFLKMYPFIGPTLYLSIESF